MIKGFMVQILDPAADVSEVFLGKTLNPKFPPTWPCMVAATH